MDVMYVIKTIHNKKCKTPSFIAKTTGIRRTVKNCISRSRNNDRYFNKIENEIKSVHSI